MLRDSGKIRLNPYWRFDFTYNERMRSILLLAPALLFACSGEKGKDSSGWRSVGVGNSHSCAISQGGGLWCWGANGSGQLGDGTVSDRSRPVRVGWRRGKGVGAVSMGYAHTCALGEDGVLVCWGDNSFGQLGNGGHSGRLGPERAVALDKGRTVVAMAAGYAHTCAILDNHALVCWGFNGSGQLGDGSLQDRTTPVVVDLGERRVAREITAGFSHSCALLDDHSVACWGGNDFGQLGDGSTDNRLTPVGVDLGWNSMVESVVAGDSHTCAIFNRDRLECWGSNRYGQLGEGSVGGERTFPALAGRNGKGSIRKVALGRHYTCAVWEGGALSCWGGNGYGQLGNASTRPSIGGVTVDLGPGRKVRSLVASEGHLCALTEGNTLVCWGNNSRGQLGDGRVGEMNGEIRLGTFESVVTGTTHSCGLREDGIPQCWGANQYGQLGDGSVEDRHSPVPVEVPEGRVVVGMSSGCDHTCGILDDDSLLCWGKNSYGQLGDGISEDYSSPVRVDFGEGIMITGLELGCEHTCAILKDEARICRGEMSFDRKTSSAHMCGIGDGGMVVCRGRNERGQLGVPTPHRGDDPREMGKYLPIITVDG